MDYEQLALELEGMVRGMEKELIIEHAKVDALQSLVAELGCMLVEAGLDEAEVLTYIALTHAKLFKTNIKKVKGLL